MKMDAMTAVLIFSCFSACLYLGFIAGMWYVREIKIDEELRKNGPWPTRMVVKFDDKTETKAPLVQDDYLIEIMDHENLNVTTNHN